MAITGSFPTAAGIIMACSAVGLLRMRRIRSIIFMTNCTRTRRWIMAVAGAFPCSTRIIMASAAIVPLGVRRDRPVVPVAVTAVHQVRIVDKTTVRRVTGSAVGSGTGLGLVSLWLVFSAMATNIAVADFAIMHKCGCRIFLKPITETNETWFTHICRPMGIMTQKTRCLHRLGMNSMMPLKGVVSAIQGGLIVAAPAKSITTIPQAPGIGLGHDIGVF